MFWGVCRQCWGKNEEGCWVFPPLLGVFTLIRYLHLQHGRSLALYHFQELWGHLLMWQVRWGLGYPMATWSVLSCPPCCGAHSFSSWVGIPDPSLAPFWLGDTPSEGHSDPHKGKMVSLSLLLTVISSCLLSLRGWVQCPLVLTSL